MTTLTRIFVGVALAAGFAVLSGQPGGCQESKEVPMSSAFESHEPREDVFTDESGNVHKATFAAGCFWGVEATFRQIPGVLATRVGYTGGHADQPTYREVCSDTTGHAEAVQVAYDPSEVTYEQLLSVFWNAHDPTQVNRQGPDYGSQYRSAVFYHDPEQKQAAERSRDALDDSRKYPRPIATKIEPAREFWPAEDYHQQYLEKRGMSSCHSGLE